MMPRPGTTQQLQGLQRLLGALVSRRPGEAQPAHAALGSAQPQAEPHQLLSSSVPGYVSGRKMPSDITQWTADDWHWYNTQMGVASGFTAQPSTPVGAGATWWADYGKPSWAPPGQSPFVGPSFPNGVLPTPTQPGGGETNPPPEGVYGQPSEGQGWPHTGGTPSAHLPHLPFGFPIAAILGLF